MLSCRFMYCVPACKILGSLIHFDYITELQAIVVSPGSFRRLINCRVYHCVCSVAQKSDLRSLKHRLRETCSGTQVYINRQLKSVTGQSDTYCLVAQNLIRPAQSGVCFEQSGKWCPKFLRFLQRKDIVLMEPGLWLRLTGNPKLFWHPARPGFTPSSVQILDTA